MLHRRGHAHKSQPKLAYGMQNDAGEFPLFRFGFDKTDWDKITPMPEPYMLVCRRIEEEFGAKVTHCLVNYFPAGMEHYLPIHQGQLFTPGEKHNERTESVYILSLGCVRPLVFTTPEDKGHRNVANMTVITEINSGHGDLFVLDGVVNSAYGHGVPRVADATL